MARPRNPQGKKAVPQQEIAENPVHQAAENAMATLDSHGATNSGIIPESEDDETKRDRLPKGAARQVGSTLSRGPGMLTQYLVPANFSRLIEYERAAKTDETVGAGLELMKLALMASIREYRHPEPEIEKFVRKSLNEMNGSIEHALGELVESSLTFGYSVSEILWKLVDGRIQIEELINYHPASLLIVPNVNGRLIDGQKLDNPFWQPPATISHTGIWQLGIDGASYEFLPQTKVCLTIHGKRSGIYTGTSAIQKIYKNWKLKDIVLEMYNVALDRYGTPIAYAIVPAGVTPDMTLDSLTGKPRNKTIREAAEEAMAGMHRGTALVFQRPSMQDDIEIATLTTGNNFGSVFLDALTYYNKSIFRGLLVPQLLLDEGSGGLSSPGQTHWNLFKLMIQALAKEIVTPFCEQVIARMIQLNFKNTDPGQFIIEPYDPAITAILATVFDKMVKNGYLNPTDQDDLNEVREMFGLPSKNVQPVLSGDDHKRILTAPADKVQNDKLKAQAAMVKAKASQTQVEHTTGPGFEQQKTQSSADMDNKKSELNLKRQDLKHKQQVDSQKADQDHKIKMMTAKHQHEQNMLSIKKGYVAQPAATAPTATKAPKVSSSSNKTSSKPKSGK